MSLLSTASTKSMCLTLALVALTTPAASALMTDCQECISSSSTIIHKSLPIHLQFPSSSSSSSDVVERNASLYYSEEEIVGEDEEDEEFELPTELAELIASAKRSSPAAAPTRNQKSSTDNVLRYYATYSEDNLCSSKLQSEFESWDVSYETLEECCDVSFSWDYDACMGI